MNRHLVPPLLAALVITAAASTAASADTATPWTLAPNTAYGYDGQFKTWQYKLGTSNAGLLLKGAKKVPKNTLFFIGANGQLYMRTGRFLDDDGNFMFGPS